MSFDAGSIGARLELDTKGFDSAASKIRSEAGKIGDGFSGSQKSVKKFADELGGLGLMTSKTSALFSGLAVGVGVVATAAAAAGAAITAATRAALDNADALSNQMAATQASAEALQVFNLAAERAGAGSEAITGAIQRMQKGIGEGSKKSVEAIRSVGLSIDQLKAMRPEEQFQAIMSGLANIPNEAEKAAAAMALFGKSGANLLALSGDALPQLEERMRSLGLIIESETVAAVDRLGDDLDLLKTTMGATVNQFGSAIASSGALRDAVNQATDVVGLLNNFIIDNRDLITSWVDRGVKPAVEWLGKISMAVGTLGLGMVRLSEINLKVERSLSGFHPMARSVDEINKELSDTRKFGDEMHATLVRMDQVLNPSKLLKSVQEFGKRLKDDVKPPLMDLPPLLTEVQEQFKKTSDTMAVMAAGMKQFEEIKHFEAIERSAEAYAEEQRQIQAATDQMAPYLAAAQERVKSMQTETVQLQALELKTFDWGKAMDGVNDFLSETRGLMTLLGVESDSVFGKMIDWASKIFDAFNSLTGMISKLTGLFSGQGGIGSMFGGGGGILGGIGRLFGIGGGATAAMGSVGALGVGGSFAGATLSAAAPGIAGGTGAAAGAATGGGGLLSGLGALFTNPITGIAAGIGAALFFGIKSFMKKGDAETTAEFLGFDFDAITGDLQKRLQEVGKQVGDFATGLQMNLSSIFAEGGLGTNFDAFAEKVADTFSFLDRGQIDAAESQRILNETVAQLLPVVGELGESGVFQMERILAAAERTGVSFQGMDQFAAAYVQRAKELGIAVNDVVLRALGLDGALAQLGNTAADSGAQATNAMDPFRQAIIEAENEVQMLKVALMEAEAAGQLDVAEGLADQLRSATQRANELRSALQGASAAGSGLGGGGGHRGDPDFKSAQGGFHSAGLPSDTLILAHQGESVDIGHGGGGGGWVSVSYSPNLSINLSPGTPQSQAEQVIDLVRRNIGGLKTILQEELGTT